MKTKLFMASLIAGFGATHVSAAEIDVVFAYVNTPGVAQTALMQTLPERISKVTNGRVEIKPTATLVAVPQIPAAMRDGQVQMAMVIPAFLGGSEPVFRLAGLPGIIDGIDDYRKVLDAFWAEDMAKVWSERWNSVILTDSAICTQAIVTREPLRTLEDYKGKKLRLNERSAAILLSKIGASTVSMPTEEVIPSLERGVIDGVGTASCWAAGANFAASAKHMSNWYFGAVQAVAFGANKDFWDGLPEDIRTILSAEFEKIETELFETYTELEKKTAALWESQGGTYYDVPVEERQKVYASEFVQPVYDEWIEQAKGAGIDGPAYIEKARAALGKTK